MESSAKKRANDDGVASEDEDDEAEGVVGGGGASPKPKPLKPLKPPKLNGVADSPLTAALSDAEFGVEFGLEFGWVFAFTRRDHESAESGVGSPAEKEEGNDDDDNGVEYADEGAAADCTRDQ